MKTQLTNAECLAIRMMQARESESPGFAAISIRVLYSEFSSRSRDRPLSCLPRCESQSS